MLCLFKAHPQHTKQPRLNFGIMNTNTTTAAFVTVDHKIVCLSNHRPWITFQLMQIFHSWRGERMMIGNPAFFFSIVNKRGEINHPANVKHSLKIIKHAKLLRNMKTKRAQGTADNIFLIRNHKNQIAIFNIKPGTKLGLNIRRKKLLDGRDKLASFSLKPCNALATLVDCKLRNSATWFEIGV